MSLLDWYSPSMMRKLMELWNVSPGRFLWRFELRRTDELPSSSPVVKSGYRAELEKFCKKFGLRTFEVSDTNSMDPMIDAAHLAIVEAYVHGKTKVEVGDVLVWGPQNIMHRLIKKTDKTFQTLGDNNAIEDPEQLWSAVKFVLRGVSYVR